MKFLIIPMVAASILVAQPAKAFIPILYAVTITTEAVWECGKRSVCRDTVVTSVTKVSKWGLASATALVATTATATVTLIKKWID